MEIQKTVKKSKKSLKPYDFSDFFSKFFTAPSGIAVPGSGEMLYMPADESDPGSVSGSSTEDSAILKSKSLILQDMTLWKGALNEGVLRL